MFEFKFSIKNFSDNLKMLRKNKNVTQSVIADGLNLTRTQISDLENAKTTTSIANLVALADYFNVSIDYLVGRNDKN